MVLCNCMCVDLNVKEVLKNAGLAEREWLISSSPSLNCYLIMVRSCFHNQLIDVYIRTYFLYSFKLKTF